MENGHIRFSSAKGRWVLLTTVLGSGIALLDSTVVNVALPALGADLDADMAACSGPSTPTPSPWRASSCWAARSATGSAGARSS
ncbi:hypothetical protein ACFQX6_01210 [Streptosporangium lutulentum]